MELRKIHSFAVRDRPVWLLLLMSVAISCVYVGTIFSLSFIEGTSSFWVFPNGTIPGSEDDMATWLVSYLYLGKTPWSLPLLFTPNLNYPAGVVTFWCDPLPWLALAGRALYSITGAVINLAGPYLVACFLLNGLAMTVLLITAGQRTLLATAVGSLQAIATPFFMFRWGHIPLMGQYTVIFSLALYLYTMRSPYRFRTTLLWFVLLSFALLTSPYLLIMSAAAWASSIYQPTRPDIRSYSGMATEFVVFMCAFFGMFYALGAFGQHLSSASVRYGYFSFNLLSPIIPQMSGVVWPASHYHMNLYEGFAYVGLGMLLLTAYNGTAWIEWVRASWRRHVLIALAFTSLLALALSNNVFIGRWQVISFDLPAPVFRALGVIRSSGRFIWPIGYALVAGTLTLALRAHNRPIGMLVLVACTAIQLVDVEPLREAVAKSVRHHAPLVLDEATILPLFKPADAVLVFPSFSCVERLNKPLLETRALLHANMELQLMAVRNDKPINSVYTGRPIVDCAAEDAMRAAPLQPGHLYLYLDKVLPQQPGIASGEAKDPCHVSADFAFCYLRPEARASQASTGG